ncbi:MAG: hypothetical protein ACLFVJ_06450 [Persicimonas sp.]
MLNVRRLMTVVMIALLGLGVGVGCTDDPAQANNANNDERVDGDPVEPPDNGELMHVDPCTDSQSSCLVSMTFNEAHDVQAKLVDPEGQPVEDALVTFEADFDDTELSLTASTAYTDEDGIATVNVAAGGEVGSGELVAKTDSESIEPISWVLSVSSKDKASFTVAPDHRGTEEIKDLDVFIFPEDVTCDDLAANPAQTAVAQKPGRVEANGNIPPVPFPDRANGETYTAVVRAMALDNDTVEAAYGCKDDNPTIENGQPVEVTVPLIDHLPEIGPMGDNTLAEYKVTHDFDLTGALPDNVRNIVELIGRLATDPGSFIVGCPDDSNDSDCPAGSPGLAQILVDFLPDGELKDAIESFLESSIGNSLVRDAINDIAQNWLDDSAPDWLNDTVDITADIYKSIRRFRVEGVIRISDSPEITVDDDTGEVIGVLPEAAGTQVWNDFIFFWSRGCENATDFDSCAQRSFGASQLDMGAVEGEFDGTQFGSNELRINQHTLSLNYGALLVAIVERVVLPEIFGNSCGSSENLPCDSLELALKEMIDCDAVASSVNSDSGSSTYQITYDLCDNLIDQAGDQLRDYASENLVADGDEVFRIGTGDNCTISQPESYPPEWPNEPLPYIQHLGGEDEEMHCDWDVRIEFTSDYTAEVDGSFWGERNQ